MWAEDGKFSVKRLYKELESGRLAGFPYKVI